jgi:tripeptide aminopeptidase
MPNSDVVDTFLEIVQIDSPSGAESTMADYLKLEFQKLGIDSEIDQAGNLFTRIEGSGEPVLLNAHLDTVEPGRGIKPQIIDGTITSDGSTILGADNKVAVAAILSAVKEVGKKNLRPLELVFSVREETDSGISQFDFTKLKSKSGLVADRASKIGSIVLASPWIMNLNIQITGTPCHAGIPENGVNALNIAASAISATKWGRIDPKTTSNIGLITGGSAMNTVPGTVNLVGEIRSFQKQNLEKFLEETKAKFETICQKSNAKCQFDSSWYCSGYEYQKDNLAVREISDIMKKINIEPFYEIAFGASDANTFVSKGIDVVCIGDGCNDPHTKQESISVVNLELLKNLIVKYIINPHE